MSDEAYILYCLAFSTGSIPAGVRTETLTPDKAHAVALGVWDRERHRMPARLENVDRRRDDEKEP